MKNETKPQLLLCPNEGCRSECALVERRWNGHGGCPCAWSAECTNWHCWYRGPVGDSAEQAAALHNRMPRTEPWVSVAERMPEDSNLEYYVALASGSVVGPMVWSGLHWQWAQDYSIFRNYGDPGSTVTHWRPRPPPRGPVSR